MLQTFEAILDERGQIKFTEPIKLQGRGRVLVTLLSEQTETVKAKTVTHTSETQQVYRTGMGLVEFFRNSPLHGLELDLSRSKDIGRDIEL